AHDLLRETAYREVTPPKRVLLHRRIAQALELVHADDLRPVSAAIADHYEHASLTERAVQYHVKAAEAASDLFANDDAIRHYERAVELERTLPPSPRRDRTELGICYAMSAPLNAQYGYASKRVHDAVKRSNELALRLGEDRVRLMSLVGLFSVLFVQGRTRESYDVGRRALELSLDHPDVIGQAHFAVAGPATSLGHLMEALEHFAVVPDLTMDLPPALVGTRTEVHSQAWSAHALWLVGRRDDAVRTSEWAVARAREVDHPYSLAVALAYATMTAQFDEDRAAVLDLSEQTRQLCDRYSFAYYGEWAAILGGWARGGPSGVDSVKRGLRGLDRQGAMARRPYFLALLADCLERSGRAHDAAAVLDSACSTATTHQDVWWLPEVLRRKALAGPERTRAKTLGQAFRMAEEQGSRVLAERLLSTLEGAGPGR
ncbi:MAG: SARP family transcriptional regulator, partial [Actinomycetes bacterium]